MTILVNDTVINEFLNSQKEGTRKTYKSQIVTYLEFTKKQPIIDNEGKLIKGIGQQLLDSARACSLIGEK